MDTVADECRALGLKVGDTIEGTESGGKWWNTTRLTLLWLGKKEAVWMKTSKSSERPDWSEPEESGNWTLSHRDWRKVEPHLTIEPTSANPAVEPASAQGETK